MLKWVWVSVVPRFKFKITPATACTCWPCCSPHTFVSHLFVWQTLIKNQERYLSCAPTKHRLTIRKTAVTSHSKWSYNLYKHKVKREKNKQYFGHLYIIEKNVNVYLSSGCSVVSICSNRPILYYRLFLLLLSVTLVMSLLSVFLPQLSLW